MAEILRLPGDGQARIQVRGVDTGGAFTLITDAWPPGWSLPSHRHANESETVHVTAGALWMEIDGERVELRPGDTVHVPRGVVHGGGTLGDEPVERVLVFAPAGMEEFFERLAQAGDAQTMLRLAGEFGWDFQPA